MMHSGTTTFWHLFRNYGFIRPDDPDEAPVWASNAVLQGFDESFRHLAKDERVLYDAVPGQPSKDGSPRQEAIHVRPAQERARGVVSEYSFLHGFGFIDADDGNRYFLHHSDILGEGYKDADRGDEVFFVPADAGARPNQGLRATAAKLGDPRPALHRFAQFPYELDQWLDPLAARASPEKWDYQHELAGRGGSYPILRHYLELTFERLLEEQQSGRSTIVEGAAPDGRRYASFNTGLVDELQKPIYALFDEHRQADDPRGWWWRGFFSEDDGPMRPVIELPTPANYLEDPAALVITPDEIRAMRVDSRHILSDHLDRFPTHLRGDPRTARKLFEGDLHELADRVRRNYKAAVPQYYRSNIQLLLPLDLGGAPGRQDLALVVERTEAGTHRASTVLGNDLAYRQSRVIARPDPEWLGRAWIVPNDDSSTGGFDGE